MVVLRVDGVTMQLRSQDFDMPRYDAEKLHSVAQWRSGVEVKLEVASTPESDAMFRYSFDLHRGEGFNDTLHSAVLEVDGVVLIEGKATLLATRSSDDMRYYLLSIRSGGSDWAEMAAHTQLNDTELDWHIAMTPYDIEQSWSGEQPVRMLPLQRDSYPMPQDSGLWGPQRVLMPTDYYPFISVRELLRSMAHSAGYSIKSRWLDSELVRKLYISGAYREVDGAAAERAMGFKAYRTQTTQATANSSGYVFACNPLSSSNIGPIVDSVDRQAIDEQGVSFADAYNNGNVLSFESGSPLFKPTRNISVAYEYKLRYRTEYRITSPDSLKGFNRIYLGPGCDVELKLENPYVDQSQNIRPNLRYRLFIFDYNSAYEYRLSGFGTVSGPISDVVFPVNSSHQTALYVRRAGSSIYTIYTGSWALYEGFVEECGERDVELVVRTPYRELTASVPEHFDSVMFYGAEPGQRLTLRSGCSVRPIFSQVAGYGDNVTFADVSHHRFSHQTLIEALTHMFNLCIYSHRESRSVVIEPYDDFFSGDVVDWRDRQLVTGWSIVEGAPECFESVRLAYAGSDGVLERESGVSDKEFGVWERHFEGYGTKQGTDSRRNPLFLPTVSLSGSVGSVPSAEVLTVGDRDAILSSDYIEPRVVLYHGMRALSDDEHWTAFTSSTSYPYAAFHSATEAETLCFEDRDGCEGLHHYYDNELEESAQRGLLRCKIYLPVADYASLFDPNNLTYSIRSRFRLEVEGSSSLYTLRAIEDYDAQRGVATVLFRRTRQD